MDIHPSKQGRFDNLELLYWKLYTCFPVLDMLVNPLELLSIENYWVSQGRAQLQHGKISLKMAPGKEL